MKILDALDRKPKLLSNIYYIIKQYKIISEDFNLNQFTYTEYKMTTFLLKVKQ